MQQQYLVCNLPKKLGGLSVQDLKDLLHREGIVRSKANNFLKTKKDMCLALTLKNSEMFLKALDASVNEFNPSLRDFVKIASAHVKSVKVSADKLQKDKLKIRDTYHELLRDNYAFPDQPKDSEISGLKNKYESKKYELESMYDRLQDKESRIRSMQTELEQQKRALSQPMDDSGLAAVKMDVMQLKMQEKYMLNAIDEIRLHVNRLKSEERTNPQSGDVQSRIFQLLEMKKELERSIHTNAGKLDTVKMGEIDPTDFAKIEESANTLSGSNSLVEDAEKIHREVEEKQHDIEQLRVDLAAVRTRLQLYVDVFPRVEDAIAFATTSVDLQKEATRLKNIIRAADGISKRVHEKMDKLSDSSLRTQQQDPDDVVSLLNNVDIILDKFDEVTADVSNVDGTLERAQSELNDLHNTFVSLVQHVDKNVDAANLNDSELVNILKDFIVNKTYLKTAITDLHQEHGIARSRTASVKSKLAEISDTLGKLETSHALVGGGGEDDDILQVLSSIEKRLEKIAQKQLDDRETYLNTIKRYKGSLSQKETDLKDHIASILDKRTEDVRTELSSIEQQIKQNNIALQNYIKDLLASKDDDKKKFSALSKKAFELLEEQTVLFHGLKIKIDALNFTDTLKTYAGIEEEPIKLDETLFDDAAKKHTEELESLAHLKLELKEALEEHTRLKNELSSVDFQIKKSEKFADHDRLLSELTQKRKDIELDILENEKELKDYEAEVLMHQQNIDNMNSDIDGDVYSALENAYQAQLASKSDRLSRVNEELADISEDDSEESLEVHRQQLHQDATMKLGEIVQKLKEEISDIRNENDELDQLKVHKVKLLEREKELTQKYLSTLEGRDSDLAHLADNSKRIHEQHLQLQDGIAPAGNQDDARIAALVDLKNQTEQRYESIQNQCREKLTALDQEKQGMLQEVRDLISRSAKLEQERTAEVDNLNVEVENVKKQLDGMTKAKDHLYEVASTLAVKLKETEKKLQDLQITTDPERVKALRERIQEIADYKNVMLSEENVQLQKQTKELLEKIEELQLQALDTKMLKSQLRSQETSINDLKIDITRGKIQYEKKSAEKAHLDKQLADIKSTIQDLMGKKLYRFDDPRSIAREPIEAVRDIAQDYDFFRNAYQDTAKDLRDNIVELVKTLNQGNTVINYDHIQSRVDALKYLSEDQQKVRLQQTRELIADDYESLVKKGMEEARLLARSYEAETEWKQIENKMNRILAPVGSIEHSRDSLKLINDFFRLTKSSMTKLKEEKQSIDIKELHDQMISHFETTLQLGEIVRSNKTAGLVHEMCRLYKTSQKISFESLESVMYRIDEYTARIIKSFLDVFKLRSDELFLELVRSLGRSKTLTNNSQRFGNVVEFVNNSSEALPPTRMANLAPNVKTRIQLMSQLFPKIELLLFKISDDPLDEQVYFDANRFTLNIGTMNSASQATSTFLFEIGAHLYLEFLDVIERNNPKWLKPEEGTKAIDENLFRRVWELKKFSVVQKQLHANDCHDVIEHEISGLYKEYGKPNATVAPSGINVFTFNGGETVDLVKYFEDVAKFLKTIKGGRSKNDTGVLSDLENMNNHLSLKQRVLRAALADKENRLKKVEKRGGTIVDSSTIVPYDIRKLNAVLTRINDMVAANMRDLQKAKAAGFENAQYEIKLKKIESDLFEKENILNQFDGITKQSVERALLLEQALVQQNKNFEDFCLFLMGQRKNPTTFFDSTKNVFGFVKNGKAIFSKLDWAKELNLSKDEHKFSSITDVRNIKGLLKSQLHNLNYASFIDVLDGLMSCHSYLQNSNSFHEENIILQEIVSIRGILKKLKDNDNDSRLMFEARFEDLIDLNKEWSQQIASRSQIKDRHSRDLLLLINSIGDSNRDDISKNHALSLALRILDFLKSKSYEFKDIEEGLITNDKDVIAMIENLRDVINIPEISVRIAIIILNWPFKLKELFACGTASLPNSTELQTQLLLFKSFNTDCDEILKETEDLAIGIKERIRDRVLVVQDVATEIISLLERTEGNINKPDKTVAVILFERAFEAPRKSKFVVGVTSLIDTILSSFHEISGGAIVKDAARQFVNKSDQLFQVLKDVVMPSKNQTNPDDKKPSPADVSNITYDSFLATVISTRGRTQIEEMLAKLKRLSIETDKVSNSQDDNTIHLATLLTVAIKLLQERLDCQDKTDELSKTMNEKLYEAEAAFQKNVEQCNERIHTANQKVLKAESEEKTVGQSSMTKGNGIAFGYMINGMSPTGEHKLDSLSSSRKSSLAPPYEMIYGDSTITPPNEWNDVAAPSVSSLSPYAARDGIATPNERIDVAAPSGTPISIPATPTEVISITPVAQTKEPDDIKGPSVVEHDASTMNYAVPPNSTHQIDSIPSGMDTLVSETQQPEAESVSALPGTQEIETHLPASLDDPWIGSSPSNEPLGPVGSDSEDLVSSEGFNPWKSQPKESAAEQTLAPSWEEHLPSDRDNSDGRTQYPAVSRLPDVQMDMSPSSLQALNHDQNEPTIATSEVGQTDKDTGVQSDVIQSPSHVDKQEQTVTSESPKVLQSSFQSERNGPIDSYNNPWRELNKIDEVGQTDKDTGVQSGVIQSPSHVDKQEQTVTSESPKVLQSSFQSERNGPIDSHNPWAENFPMDRIEKKLGTVTGPEQRPRTMSDAVFDSASLEDVQMGYRNILHDDVDAWGKRIVGGGNVDGGNEVEANVLAHRLLGSLLLLYIHYSRFIKNPQILRLISTVDHADGSFVGALKTSGVNKPEEFCVELLRLIFVDVTDFVLPDETRNNKITDRFVSLKNAHTNTYQMQLQALGMETSKREVIRTDLFFRFCLDLSAYVGNEKLASSLKRVNDSFSQTPSEKFTNLDVFLIQVTYLSDVKRNMINSSLTMQNQECLKEFGLNHTLAATSAVLTYVKVRCDQNLIWNERYRLDVLRHQAAKKEMLVEFNTHTFPYYSHDQENALRGFRSISNEAKTHLPNGSHSGMWAIGDNLPYQYHMLFGPFTKVFGPDLSVQQIVEECEAIKTTLVSGKSVMMLGYGASGSGKTSTLVCQSGHGACQEPGILPGLLADKTITSRYRNVKLSICEFFAGDNRSLSGQVNWKTQDMRFRFDGSIFVFQASNDTHDLYTPLPENSKNILAIGERTRIDTVIHHCIEVDRRSRGTTNNPNSSRSHVLVFIHFVGENDTNESPFLILGDFAGVENEFICDDFQTLMAIYNSQKCNDVGDCVRVYTPAVSDADFLQSQRGQCGAGSVASEQEFVLYGDNNTVPDTALQAPMIWEILKLNKGFSELKLRIPPANHVHPFNKTQVKDLLISLRANSDWLQEKVSVKGLLFSKSESDTYIDMSKTGESSIALNETLRKRLELTISLIAAGYTVAEKDGSVWGTHVLNALDAFRGPPGKARTHKPQDDARWELWELLKTRRDCVVDLFGFDAHQFEKAIREQGKAGQEVPNQLKGLSRRFKALFDKMKTLFPKEKNTENMFRIEQFLIAVLTGHIQAFDLSYQTVKRMMTICKCRTHEGRYINNSLEQVRDIIKGIIQQQQQETGKLRTTPGFADACLPIYCNPFNEGCLDIDEEDKQGRGIAVNKSLLMKTISDKIGLTEFQNMKIAVFTVFLMNRAINNDPPVPFIYAEDLRSEYVRLKNFDSGNELVHEIDMYLSGPTKDAVMKDIGRFGFGQESDIRTGVINDLRSQVSNQRSRLGENVANNLISQLGFVSSKSMNTVKNLLRTLDGINAVHPIGTLQFTDAIAKFNMSDMYCSFSQNSTPFVAQLREKLEGKNCFVNLMSKKHMILLPPADPVVTVSKVVGGAMFDPKTIDEFLHQWLVTTGSAYTDYLYKLSNVIEKKGGQRKEAVPKKRRRNSRKRSSIGMPLRKTKRF